MKRDFTAKTCLARACRLTMMADSATDYETILTYEALAIEWLEVAARCAHRERPARIEAPAAPASAPRRRRKWLWFL
jgi:hypothetical protein